MKKLTVVLAVLVGMISGCQKGKDVVSANQVNPPAKPTASFQISNPIQAGWVLEGSPVIFDNKSTNADSYYWDFGNGSYSTDKTPDNIAFSPCGHTYTITLTAKTKSGDVAVYSETINVLCSGKHPNPGG